MKKISFFIVGILLLVGMQIHGRESEFYARTVKIERVFPHPLGYKILYTTSRLDVAAAYIPHRWFAHSSTIDGKLARGEVMWGDDPSFPFMMIFWRNGEFSHVRLFLRRNMNDLSWGTLNPTADLAERFNIEELTLEF